ncbi:MAG TPA: hypothetical protein VK157_11605 [Phycisphaerales bacterium]|nr:hypothetical protein [Phycisphaerales bacterium]
MKSARNLCLVALACSTAAFAQPTLVGFSTVRGGGTSLPTGSLISTLRSGIVSGFPGVSLRGVNSLTELDIATDTAAVLFSGSGPTSGITPLTTAEQSALLNFVLAGRGAVIFVDNDTFAGPTSDAVNESLIDPFNMDVTGTGPAWARNATVAAPANSPVTSGPFGIIANFNIGWTGTFSSLSPAASSIAIAVDNGQPVLATIPCGALGPTSGPVVFVADSTLVGNGYITPTNLALARNIIAYIATPCTPACDDIDFNNNGVFPEDQDVVDFFDVLAGGSPATCDPVEGCNDIDFNNNGVFPEDQDVVDFFNILAGGTC